MQSKLYTRHFNQFPKGIKPQPYTDLRQKGESEQKKAGKQRNKNPTRDFPTRTDNFNAVHQMKRSEVVTKKLSCYFTIEMKVKNVTKRKSSSMNKLQRWKQGTCNSKKDS